MRQNPHVRICGGPGSATTLVYPTKIINQVSQSLRYFRPHPVSNHLTTDTPSGDHAPAGTPHHRFELFPVRAAEWAL